MNLETKKILFVFEGKNTEPEILNNLKKFFLKEDNNIIVETIFDAEIFQFMKLIKEDPFLDLVGLLKQRDSSNDVLANYDSSEEFTSIYLFFDHDAHSHSDKLSIKDYHKDIEETISVFNNETENGKLYISYPMVESIRDTLVEPDVCTTDCCTYVSLNTKYKHEVNTSCKKPDFRKWLETDWYECITENLIRCFMLNNGVFKELENISYEKILSSINQSLILSNQLKFYNMKQGQIIVISAFPIFLQDYYGKTLFDKLDFSARLNKYCSYFCIDNSNIII